MPPMYGDFGDGLSLLYIANLYYDTHYNHQLLVNHYNQLLVNH